MKTAPNLDGFVNVKGEPWRPSFEAMTAKPRVAKSGSVEFHKGFVVTGYAPGRIAEAERLQERALAKWAEMEPKAQAEEISAGRRPPEPWDQLRWMAKNKPSKVRTKPYELEDAANVCAELAKRAGWEFVTVTAIAQGQPAVRELF
jgi:hypothetical protein